MRTVAVRGSQFLVNGEPVHLTGFGRHEDHVTVGKGHNDALMLLDCPLLEWIGANSLRTSHYPYSEDVLDLADRRGVLVIDETAAAGMNMGLGGGIFGAQGYTSFASETINEQTREVHAQAIRELVARDKNHPSVVLWSIANEPESETAEAEDYFRPLFALTRELDPTRPVGFVNVMLAPYGTCRVSQFADVLMLNRYYGWYVRTADLIAAELPGQRSWRLGGRGETDRHHRVWGRHPRGAACGVPAAVAALLQQAGRRNDPGLAERISTTLRAPALRQPATVEHALGVAATGLIEIITAMSSAIPPLACSCRRAGGPPGCCLGWS